VVKGTDMVVYMGMVNALVLRIKYLDKSII
jgi:hypothetical protein